MSGLYVKPTERYSAFNVTEVRSKEFVYTWKVTNFKLLHVGTENYTNSKVVVDAQTLWSVNLFPDGYDNESEEFIGVNIVFVKKSVNIKDLPYLFLVHVIDNNGKEHEMHKSTEMYDSNDDHEHIFVPKLVERNYVCDEKNGLLPNGNLILRFKIYFTGEVVTAANTMYTSSYASKPMLNDLENILNNEKFSDVKIVVGEKIFYAYKGILANQSPVFAAMFEHDMKESQENIVNVADIDHQIMEEMLRFIYAGKVNNIEAIAHNLLIAADKYELDQLKMMCEESLINDLNVQTVTSLLILAEKYGAKVLRERALEFFKLNAKDIVQSEIYKTDINRLLPVLPDVIKSFVL